MTLRILTTPKFKVGDLVSAKYDDQFYDAKILEDLGKGRFKIQYIDDNFVKECSSSLLRVHEDLVPLNSMQTTLITPSTTEQTPTLSTTNQRDTSTDIQVTIPPTSDTVTGPIIILLIQPDTTPDVSIYSPATIPPTFDIIIDPIINPPNHSTATSTPMVIRTSNSLVRKSRKRREASTSSKSKKLKQKPRSTQNVQQYRLLETAKNDLIHDDEEDEEIHIVIIPPDDQNGTDTEAIDEEYLDDISSNIGDQPEIAGSIEIHSNRPGPSRDSEPSVATELTSHFMLKSVVEEVLNSSSSKDEKIDKLIEAQKKIVLAMKGSWKQDNSAVLSDNTRIPIPQESVLNNNQQEAKQKIVDRMAGLQPVEAFEVFFDEEFQDYLIEETNRYANVQQNDPGFNLNREDLKKFVGVLLFSGYHSLPRLRMYWGSQTDTDVKIVRDCISRQDFEKIKRYLHLADNGNLDTADKNAKVRPLYDITNKKLQQFGSFATHYSIDEQMIPYSGRHSSKQTIRTKSVRFGFKSFVLATYDGYPYNLVPYSGARGVGGTSGSNLTSRAVLSQLMELTSALDNTAVYFDNWFSSAGLVSLLGIMGVACTSNVRKDRVADAPIATIGYMKKSSTPRGYYSAAATETWGTVCVRWKDNAAVTLLSNCEAIEPLDKAKRYSRLQGCQVEVERPKLIGGYNRYMGGVDRLDADVAVYRIRIKSKKWWFNHFPNNLRVLLSAALYLYNMANPLSKMDNLEFTRQVTTAYLCSSTSVRISRSYARVGNGNLYRIMDSVRLFGRTHWPTNYTSPRHCAWPSCKKRVRTGCKTCNVALCIDQNDHFQLFHTSRN